MSRHILLGVLCLYAFGGFVPACMAGFITISTPGSAHPLGGTYVNNTNLIAITAPEFDLLTSLTDGFLTVDFSTEMQVRQVDTSWGNWSSPPFSESAFPTVLWTQGVTTLTMDFSQPVRSFGFELEPNEIGLFALTATFFNGANVVGAITDYEVEGDAGARLFAGVVTLPSDLPFTSVQITGAGKDFAIAQLRYATIVAVPEPSMLTISFVLMTIWFPFRDCLIRRR